MAAARAATLPARGPAGRDLAVPSAPHVQYVLALLSATLLVLLILLVPVQLHFFIDMPILNMLMQRLPGAVIIVFLTTYGSDTNHLTIVQPPPPYTTPPVCWRCVCAHIQILRIGNGSIRSLIKFGLRTQLVPGGCKS